MLQKAFLLALVVLLFSTCLAADIDNSAAIQSVKARVTIEGDGEITGSLKGTPAKFEVLSFRRSQVQEIVSLREELEINRKLIRPERTYDQWGNSYALFRIDETGKFKYVVEAVIETDSFFPQLLDYNLAGEITDFPEFAGPTENIESNHESIRTLALNRFEGESWLNTVLDITQWTNSSVEYDLGYFPETYTALETLETRKGVCDEYAGLAAALLRAKGIPTRLATGITYSPDQGVGWNGHAWLESFNPNTGWIALDPTFGEAGLVDGTHILRGFSRTRKIQAFQRQRLCSRPP